MARKTKEQHHKDLENLVEARWQASRLRLENRKKYDALQRKLKGRPIWAIMPGKKSSDQAVEDWAMLLPLPYAIPTYAAAYAQTIRAAYKHQRRSIPPFLYYHKLGVSVHPVTVKLPPIFSTPQSRLKKELKALNFDFKVLLELEPDVQISFNALAHKEEVLEKVSAVFNKVNEFYSYTKSVRPAVYAARWGECFEVYEKHNYGKLSLADIADKKRKLKETRSAARRRIENYYEIAEMLIDGKPRKKIPRMK